MKALSLKSRIDVSPGTNGSATRQNDISAQHGPVSQKGQKGQKGQRGWKARIESGDIPAIWRTLYRMISRHPLVRSGSYGVSGSGAVLPLLHDLTQDLYLHLLQKDRFHYFLTSEMPDHEIEREISQIELTNLLIGGLRRQRPENYRLARRIGAVLTTDDRFRQFERVEGRQARYRQAAEALYGLRQWPEAKAIKNSSEFPRKLSDIPMRLRDRRRSGCTGDAQVIISNQELGDLLQAIMEAIDSPVSLRVMRQLALSKLPLHDPVLITLDDEARDGESGRPTLESLAICDESPEKIILRHEEAQGAQRLAIEFLDRLSTIVRSNAGRAERLWRVLWHVYFDPAEPTQVEIAEMLGLSDSSISDYRRKLLVELQKLKISPDQISVFAAALEEQLMTRLSLPVGARSSGQAGQARQGSKRPVLPWNSYVGYGSSTWDVVSAM